MLTLNTITHSQNANEQGKQEEQHNPRPINSTPSYASVLSQGASNQQLNQNHSLNKPQPQQQQQQQQKNEENDPFAAIRELGQRSNGLYNYFQ